jgi:hypothetical protein
MGWLYSTIDSSWQFGLAELYRMGAVFGRDVLFTYGPLGFAVSPVASGATWVTATACAIYYLLYGAWWFSVAGVFSVARSRAEIGTIAVVSAICSVAAFDVPLICVANCIVVAQLRGSVRWALLAAWVAGTALLIKFNIGVASSMIVACWAMVRFVRERDFAGLLGVAAVGGAASVVPFFLLGGSLGDFVTFLRHGLLLSSEYSSHMTLASLPESDEQRGLMLAAFVLGYGAVTIVLIIKRHGSAVVFSLLFIPIFFCYKAGVTRCDGGHLIIGVAAISCLVSLLCLVVDERWRQVVSTFAIALAAATFWSVPRGPLDIVKNVYHLVTWSRTERIYTDFGQELLKSDRIPERMIARIGGRTVDVYPEEINQIVANGLAWRPRYMFQSYQVSSPRFDQRNAECYQGDTSPEFVLFRYGTFDTRNMFLVDPQTVRALQANYRTVDSDRTTLLLQRRESPRVAFEKPLGTAVVRLEQEIEVPREAGAVVLGQVRLRMTRLGRLLSMLYRVAPPKIEITYDDGSIVLHSMPWRNGAAGYPLSSLPRDLAEARRFLEGDTFVAPVRSIKITADPWAFEHQYELAWVRHVLTNNATPVNSSSVTSPFDRLLPMPTR